MKIQNKEYDFKCECGSQLNCENLNEDLLDLKCSNCNTLYCIYQQEVELFAQVLY